MQDNLQAYGETLHCPNELLHLKLCPLQVIADLQLDDWAVKEKEIEIMRNADGSLCELGHGAFGQVCLPSQLPCWLNASALEQMQQRASAIAHHDPISGSGSHWLQDLQHAEPPSCCRRSKHLK